MYKELINQVAIITGAYGDIGNAIAKKFAENNMKIALLGRNKKLLDAQAIKLSNINSTDIITFKCDVSDIDAIDETVKIIVEKWGRIDVLINNAGVTKDNLILRMPKEDWDLVLNTNLGGTFNTSKLVAKQMIKQKSGRIINISSVVAQIGNKGQSNYVASKAAIDGLTKTLAKELGVRGINVNAIAPGYIETNMTENLNSNIKDDSAYVMISYEKEYLYE